jgi:hypothetical protein
MIRKREYIVQVKGDLRGVAVVLPFLAFACRVARFWPTAGRFLFRVAAIAGWPLLSVPLWFREEKCTRWAFMTTVQVVPNPEALR